MDGLKFPEVGAWVQYDDTLRDADGVSEGIVAVPDTQPYADRGIFLVVAEDGRDRYVSFDRQSGHWLDCGRPFDASRQYSGPRLEDRIKMPFMGVDAQITVAYVSDWQPHEEHGVFRILDQNDDMHLVELDGDTWVTTTEDAIPTRAAAPGM